VKLKETELLCGITRDKKLNIRILRVMRECGAIFGWKLRAMEQFYAYLFDRYNGCSTKRERAQWLT
jgi:hypothetical protein